MRLKYFNRYNVVAVIPSHTFYVPYGIIMRFALTKIYQFIKYYHKIEVVLILNYAKFIKTFH